MNAGLPIAAAARELYEETGLKAQALNSLLKKNLIFTFWGFLVQRYTEVPVARSDALELLYLNRATCAQGQFPKNCTNLMSGFCKNFNAQIEWKLALDPAEIFAVFERIRTLERQVSRLHIRATILNKFIELGRPQTLAVA